MSNDLSAPLNLTPTPINSGSTFFGPLEVDSQPEETQSMVGKSGYAITLDVEKSTQKQSSNRLGDTLPMPDDLSGIKQVPTKRLEQELISLLRCPRCHAGLELQQKSYKCVYDGCGFDYPLTGSIPILVDPKKSIFDLSTFQRQDPTFFRPTPAWRQKLSNLIPEMSSNISADRVFARLRSLLVSQNEFSNVLVVGGGVVGSGMEVLLHDPKIRLIETDAAVAERTQIICDAHDLPFADGSMDAVIVQAVLEHVVSPQRCVAEIYRVLKPGGLVYSDTPFMQQVHGRQYDFTRFTRLGHRRLFRQFEEVESGISCGPGMALAWSLRYFLMSFSDHPAYRAASSAFSRLAFWWLAHLDPFLTKRESANDAASAFYFLGSKSNTTLDDRVLLNSYVGGQ